MAAKTYSHLQHLDYFVGFLEKLPHTLMSQPHSEICHEKLKFLLTSIWHICDYHSKFSHLSIYLYT